MLHCSNIIAIVYKHSKQKGIFISEAEDAGQAFSKQLDVGHKVACLWRGNSCPESLVQFLPTPQSALIAGYKDRCDGLMQFQSLPSLSPDHRVYWKLIVLEMSQKLISLCGWEPRWLQNV
ncbi:hypothetical protein GOBAR_DD07080 [Gossypium barbadense]|nr:hypothetical protein GOBAR_DD07080 [Gossypium barbadense]